MGKLLGEKKLPNLVHFFSAIPSLCLYIEGFMRAFMAGFIFTRIPNVSFLFPFVSAVHV
jgi:hypothetical protein